MSLHGAKPISGIPLALGFLLAMLVLFGVPAQADSAAPGDRGEGIRLRVVTEEFPPFNFTRDGHVQGAATEVVTAVLQRAGIGYEIHSYPWARSYQQALQSANTLIYSISRRENREQLFQWIGSIVPPFSTSVFALQHRSDIRIERLQDLRGYQIGTSVDDARETYLLQHGFALADLQRVAGFQAHADNYRKLKSGRIDLWPMPDAVMRYTVEQLGDDPDTQLRRVFELDELSASGLYLAAGKQTPVEVVERIRNALEAFKQTADYREIISRWGL